MELPNERLNAKSAFVYITYKDLANDLTGEPVERKAIVRSVIDELLDTYLSRVTFWSGEKAS